ncbi:MAG TPA: hypothetical protein VLH12_15945 [Usitatibacter sp.]|nr:hypothetical protein [Usitatibacter sp.]
MAELEACGRQSLCGDEHDCVRLRTDGDPSVLPNYLKVYLKVMRSRLSEIASARKPLMAGINSRDGANVVP